MNPANDINLARRASGVALAVGVFMFVLVDGWHLVIEMLLKSFSSA